MYSDNFLTDKEFEEMFDLTLYKQVRAKYTCNSVFPFLYDKIRPELDVVAAGNDAALLFEAKKNSRKPTET